jgi:hypothetical protein
MDLKKQILKEHSKVNCKRITKYVGTSKKRFADLMAVYLEGPYRVTQRAAWPISYCVEEHPELIKPHLKKMLNFMKKPCIHVAVKRNTMRLLQFIEIPKNLQAQVIDQCFELLTNKKETIAVQVFAMTVLANISKDIPELKNELRFLIEDRLPYASAGFIARAKMVLKGLDK